MIGWLWLVGCGDGGGGRKDPEPPPDHTGTSPTTETTTPVEVPCVDAAPEHAMPTVVTVVVPEGGEAPACDWTCDAPWTRDGEACVLDAPCARGWCFEQPSPQPDRVMAGWSEGGEIWFSTWSRMLWRLGPAGLEAVPQPGLDDMALAIFGSPGDLWIVGSSTVRRWDGSSLVDGTPPATVLNLSAVAVWDDTRAWAVGGAQDTLLGGALHTFDGTTWTLAVDGFGRDPFVAVSMSGPDTGFVASDRRVYAVGAGGFTELPGYPGTSVRDVAARGDEVVVADGYDGVFRWDGAAWSQLRLRGVSSLWSDGTTVYAAGESVLRLDGATFVPVDVGAAFAASVLWGDGALQGAGGWAGELATLEPAGWTALAGGVRVDWTEASAPSDDEVWLAGWSDVLLGWDGTAWVEETMPRQADVGRPSGLYAPGGGELWLATGSGLWHREPGSGWDRRGPQGPYGDVHGRAGDDVWAVTGDGEVVHLSAAGVETVDPGIGPLGLVFVAGPDEVWVGTDWVGDLARWDGTTWTAARLQRSWVAIDGTGPDDVWALNADGEVWHWDGATFTRQHRWWFAPWFTDLVAFAPDDVWALTGGSDAYHWDGSDWSRSLLPASAATATRRGGVPLLVGDGGGILFPEP